MSYVFIHPYDMTMLNPIRMSYMSKTAKIHWRTEIWHAHCE